MAIKRRLTARFVKRLVVLVILVVVFRLCWTSMFEVFNSEPVVTQDGNIKTIGLLDKTVPTIRHVEERNIEPTQETFVEIIQKTGIKNKERTTTVVNKKKKMADICHRLVPFRSTSPDTISTFDLPAVTDYSLDETGNYKLPQEVYRRAELPLQEELQVLIVPFSHADPGYGLTVEDYYQQHTRNVLTLMINKLSQYPNMTFQWVETVFLERWFQDISNHQKDQVRQLIKDGRLEIVMGGWVMPDEALTRYTSVIDQLIEGHQWVKENLGVVPENAWVNDPFGFSSTMPYLWKSSGINNLVILRIHQAIKATLMKSKSLEFMWRPYWKRDPGNDILTNIMPYTNYWASDVCGPVQKTCRLFNFLHMEADAGFVYEVTDDNVEYLATEMYNVYKLTAGIYEYNNLVIFLGEDNSYSQEDAWDNTYHNYVKLMEFINNKPEWKMKIKFGTMREYFANIRNQEAGKHFSKTGSTVLPKFPVLSGDFFPYSDRENAYWTGYYTTRPSMKKLSREIEPVLKAADVYSVILYHFCIIGKKCSSILNEFKQILDNLRSARRELGLYQHHDGITGTSVPYVVVDYEMRLIAALEKSKLALQMALVSLLTNGKNSNPTKLQSTYEKVDAKSIRTDKLYYIKREGLAIVATNPLEKSRYEIISVLIDKPNVNVFLGNKTIFSQLSKLDHTALPSNAGYLLSFRVKLAPFEIQTVLVKESNSRKRTVYHQQPVGVQDTITLHTRKLKVDVDAKTCMLNSIKDIKGRTTYIKSRFMKYRSQASGAYLFGPSGPAEEIPGCYDHVTAYILKGPLLSEINCFFSSGFSQGLRLYNTSGAQGDGLHVSNVIDLETDYRSNNIEVILRFQTDIRNDNILFTDQNSFQLMGRKTYPDHLIQSNYYPISSMAVIEDMTKRLTLHSAQPNGVASLEDGWLEVMLDRNMETDDGRGLGSGVYDKIKTLSEFILQVEYKTAESSLEEERYTYPTLHNILLNDLFQYPIQLFALFNADNSGDIDVEEIANTNAAYTDNLENFISNYIPGSLEFQLHCDISLVNLRLLVANDLKVIGTSIVLHRKPVHCLFDHVLKKCNAHHKELYSKDLLGLVGLRNEDAAEIKLRETSLSHLHMKQEITFKSDLRPEVNELRSILIRFNEI